MNSSNTRYKIYISHPIRGKKGPEATHEDQMKWINIMRVQAQKLKQKFPEVEWYVPGEHDEFVQVAFDMGMLTVDDILEVDGAIVRTCDAIVYFDLEGEFSGGMLYEQEVANDAKLPSLTISDPRERESKIRSFIDKLDRKWVVSQTQSKHDKDANIKLPMETEND